MTEQTPPAPVTLLLASASPARLATLSSAGVTPRVQVSGVDEDAVLADATARYGELEPADAALVLARAKAEAVAATLTATGTAAGDGPAERQGHDGDSRLGASLTGGGDTAGGEGPSGSGRSSGAVEAGDAEEPIDAPTDDDVIVLGCDSVLELDGRMYGKPADAADARDRWRRMRGREGTLRTGHWIIDERNDGTGGTFGATASTVVRFAELDDAEIDAYVATGEPLAVAGAFTVDGMGGAFVTSIDGDFHNVVGVSLPLLREMLAEIEVPWPALWPR